MGIIRKQTHFDLITAIEASLKILKLIEAKRPERTGLINDTDLEAKYYRAVKADIEAAQKALNNGGGIAEKVGQDESKA